MKDSDFKSLLADLERSVDLSTACYALGYKPSQVLKWAETNDKIWFIKRAEAESRKQMITTLNALSQAGDVPATRELRTLLGIDGKTVQREKILAEVLDIAETVLDAGSVRKLLRALHDAED